jgi:hypothetical protein
MLKKLGVPMLLAGSVLIAAGSASALQVVVTSADKNSDGSTTYHYAIKTDPGETFTAGSDFITIYNFSLVSGSGNSPAGWSFSSEEFGKTPTWNGYPVVGPVDIPQLTNLTWTASQTVDGGTQIDGFSATTKGKFGVTDGEYSAQITRSVGGKAIKQAVLGHIPAPAFVQ